MRIFTEQQFAEALYRERRETEERIRRDDELDRIRRDICELHDMVLNLKFKIEGREPNEWVKVNDWKTD